MAVGEEMILTFTLSHYFLKLALINIYKTIVVLYSSVLLFWLLFPMEMA